MADLITRSIFAAVEFRADDGSRVSAQAVANDPLVEPLGLCIVAGAGPARFYRGSSEGELREARESLSAAAAVDRLLVGHDVHMALLFFLCRWGVDFARAVDMAHYLRLLGLADDITNGARLVAMAAPRPPAARDLVAEVEATRALFEHANTRRFQRNLERNTSMRAIRENVHGLAIDMSRAATLLADMRRQRQRTLQRFSRDYPRFHTAGLSDGRGAREFCAREFGVHLEKLGRKEVAVATARQSSPVLAAFLNLRDEYATLDAAISNMAKIASGPSRLLCPLRYHGAHTGRFSSSGADAGGINIQSAPKGGDDKPEILEEYRTVLVADPDESWVSCDLSSIEVRVLAFLAGQESLLEKLREGGDIYRWFGGIAFPGVVIDAYLREICKQALIGLGYGMGLTTFTAKVLLAAPGASIEQIEQAFATYRALFPEISRFRAALFEKVKMVLSTIEWVPAGKLRIARLTDIHAPGVSVGITLPTGRVLTYRSIVRKGGYDDRTGGTKSRFEFAPALRLDEHGEGISGGQNRYALKPTTLIENVCSGVARDVFFAMQREIEKDPRFKVRFSVHDEFVVSTPRCTCPRRSNAVAAGAAVESNHEPDCGWNAGRRHVHETMSRLPPGFPELQGLPLACALNDRVLDHWAP